MKLLFVYSSKSIRFIWTKDKQYIVLTMISIVLSAIRTFPGMYLMSYSIDLLTKHVLFGDYIRIVSFIIGIMLALNILSISINNRLGYVKKRLYTK